MAGGVNSGSVESHGEFFNEDSDSFSGDIYCRYGELSSAGVKIGEQQFSVISTIHGGTYTGTTYDYWYIPYSFDSETIKGGGYLLSFPDAEGLWSNNLISGKGVGYWVNLDDIATGVCGADLKGTFNPDNTTWQTAAMWAGMDTETFLAMADTANTAGQEKLAQLNIPCIEVGRTNLAGNNENLYVNMTDTTFFAYSTGVPPRIWATGDVSGSYTSDPSVGTRVRLSGTSTTCNINANFDVQKWDPSVYGSGTVAGDPIEMSGAAAGTYDTDTFSGTGAGVAYEGQDHVID